MGLASALSTALTGMTASETTIDVVGNNLANANTVGFKASTASFVTQFLQTSSIGSSPTDTNGGTNPSQTGLGTVVAGTTANFSQGTIQNSSNDLDMAIEGDGFYIVGGDTGQQLYTRDGEFTLNSANEMVTQSGNRVLGYGVDSNYNISSTTLEPISVPLGNKSVAQATTEAVLEGTLSASGQVADAGTILQTAVLDDAQYTQPATTTATSTLAASAKGTENTTTPGTLTVGTYYYRVTCYNPNQITAAGTTGLETNVGSPFSATIGALSTATSIDLTTLPTLPAGCTYTIYRTDVGGTATSTFYRVTTGLNTTSYTDTGTKEVTTYTTLNELNAQYTYYITFYNSSGESRPTQISASTYGAQAVLGNLPTDSTGNWTGWKLYRSVNTAGNSNYYYVGKINSGSVSSSAGYSFIDNASDTSISGTGAQTLIYNGPSISGSTLAKNLLLHTTNDQYDSLYTVGSTFRFTGIKGGVTQSFMDLPITDTTTVQNILDFMAGSMGIRTDTGDSGGVSVVGSKLQITGNEGTYNSLQIKLSGLQLLDSTGGTSTINMPFTSTQVATGESAMTDFVAYDSLGSSLNVHVTAVLVDSSSTATTWRWYADSSSNANPSDPNDTSVGTGTISFDGSGNFLSSTNSTVMIYRNGTAAISPETFTLDFTKLSGLSSSKSTLAVSSQDGSAAGTLTSYLVGTDGVITGVFSNGITRDLGQIVLARFANKNGLVQMGENLFSTGVNSGLPIVGTPGSNGTGSIVSGAIEQSNTDIGGNLIDLILASTMYRGNARVISTVQTMFDELLQLRAG